MGFKPAPPRVACVTRYPEDYGALRDGSTDDTAAVQAALDAAVAACVADATYVCAVQFSAGIYQLTSATTMGGTTRGNAQIRLPNREPAAGPKVTVMLLGPRDGGAFAHWQQAVGQKSGAVLRTTLTGQTPDGTWKSPSVIGGPTVTLTGGGEFSNIRVVTDGIQVAAPANPSVIALDVRRCAQWLWPGAGFAAIVDGTPLAMSAPTNDNGIGVYAPSINNNDAVSGGRLVVAGFYYGVGCSDHFDCANLTTLYANTAMFLNTGGVSNYVHGIHVGYWSAEAITTILEKTNDGAGNHTPITIDRLDTETVAGTPFKDAGNNLYGHISYASNDGADPAVTGCANVKIENVNRARGNITAPAVPASTVAATAVFRDAMVVVIGGTVTAITVDGVATGLTSGAVLVPCGKTIAITYSSVPTWKWWLL